MHNEISSWMANLIKQNATFVVQLLGGSALVGMYSLWLLRLKNIVWDTVRWYFVSKYILILQMIISKKWSNRMQNVSQHRLCILFHLILLEMGTSLAVTSEKLRCLYSLEIIVQMLLQTNGLCSLRNSWMSKCNWVHVSRKTFPSWCTYHHRNFAASQKVELR